MCARLAGNRDSGPVTAMMLAWDLEEAPQEKRNVVEHAVELVQDKNPTPRLRHIMLQVWPARGLDVGTAFCL